MTGQSLKDEESASRPSLFQKLTSNLFAIASLPIFTVFLIYSWNSNQVAVADFLFATLILVACNLVFIAILRLIFPDNRLANLVAACVFISLILGSYFVSALMPVWAVAWLGVAVLVVFKPDIRPTIRSLVTCIGLAVLALGIFNFVIAINWEAKGDPHKAAVSSFSKLPEASSQEGPSRDIYYIVLDRYARADQLFAKYNHDNSPFLSTLRENGFSVAGQAYSNYHRTAHSLASSLNLDYLDKINPDKDIVSGAFQPVYGLIENSTVARFLKRAGYAFEFYGSWWEPTRNNPLADRIVNYRALPEVLRLIVNNSLPGYLADRVNGFSFNTRKMQCIRARRKFEELAQAPLMASPEKPRFVFAHFLVPHPPFVLDEEGNCLTSRQAEARTREENYVGQLKYANQQILKFLDKVQRMSGPKPVIVLQADEGPWPKKFAGDEIHKLGLDVSRVDWLSADTEQLREKMGILNALYLPGMKQQHVYPTLSPVNNFRIVLREYFGASLPALPDKAYVFSSNEDIYRFHQMNEKLSGR